VSDCSWQSGIRRRRAPPDISGRTASGDSRAADAESPGSHRATGRPTRAAAASKRPQQPFAIRRVSGPSAGQRIRHTTVNRRRNSAFSSEDWRHTRPPIGAAQDAQMSGVRGRELSHRVVLRALRWRAGHHVNKKRAPRGALSIFVSFTFRPSPFCSCGALPRFCGSGLSAKPGRAASPRPVSPRRFRQTPS